MNSTDNISDKEVQLIKLLKKYPHPKHNVEQFKGLILCIVMSAHENGWTDEFIRICESNPDATFDDITKLIFTESRFPPLEIIDDDEDE